MRRVRFETMFGERPAWFGILSIRYWGHKRISVFFGRSTTGSYFVNFSKGIVGPTWDSKTHREF